VLLREEAAAPFRRLFFPCCPAREATSGLGASQLSEVMEALETMVTGSITGGGLQVCLIQLDLGRCWLSIIEPAGENYYRQILMLSHSFSTCLELHIFDRNKACKETRRSALSFM